jgi:hypothetical protein
LQKVTYDNFTSIAKHFHRIFKIRVKSLNLVLVLEPEFLKLFDSITCLSVLKVTFPLGVEEVKERITNLLLLAELASPIMPANNG